MTHNKHDRSAAPPAAAGDPIQLIHDVLQRLRFGAINLTVHEGRLVQVDVTEKRRFT